MEGDHIAKKLLDISFNDNYDMNSVDMTDHLRTNYVLNQGLRQRKWRWSIFLLTFDVTIVNSFLLYKAYIRSNGLEPLYLLLRHFQGMDGF